MLLQSCALARAQGTLLNYWNVPPAMMASRERGRPARTKPGTASAISPTWINRERRHGSPSAWPMRFPQTGWLPAASHGSSGQPKGQHAGGTPALPGKAVAIRGKTATGHECTNRRHPARHAAQRQPKGQHAGGTPALPSPPLGQGCSRRQGGCLRIALKLSGSQRDSMRAGRPRSRARPFPPTGWLPAASHRSSAAANGTACGRDARAPRQGCSRRQGGCLWHCTEAQRQPKGQHAGGTPALPGKAKTGNMVYTFHQCIIHSLRGSSWITLFSPSRPLADPYRSSSNPFVDIFFCLRHGLATSLPTEPAGCGASG